MRGRIIGAAIRRSILASVRGIGPDGGFTCIRGERRAVALKDRALPYRSVTR